MNKPKLEHLQKAIKYMGAPVGCDLAVWFICVNTRINEIALAEQQAQQESEYITAEQAKKLGAGNAEFHKPVPAYQSLNDWDVVGYTHQYSHHNKYRAIKQSQPEPVDEQLYCMVAKQGEPAKRMLRKDAQELQRQTDETHEWRLPNGSYRNEMYANGKLTFTDKGTYTYAPKALKQVKWSDMPVGVMTNKGVLREVFMATYGDKRQHATVEVEMPTASSQKAFRHFYCADLELAHASEQPWIYWSGGKCPVPEGCTFEVTFRDGDIVTQDYSKNWNWTHTLEIGDIIAYRITGIAKGYKMEGAV